jgi:hypothetical protein
MAAERGVAHPQTEPAQPGVEVEAEPLGRAGGRGTRRRATRACRPPYRRPAAPLRASTTTAASNAVTTGISVVSTPELPNST